MIDRRTFQSKNYQFPRAGNAAFSTIHDTSIRPDL